MAMAQRNQVKLFCAVVCLLIAVFCALNRAPTLALVNAVAAVFVWRVGFGRNVDSVDVDTLIGELRDASQASENRSNSVLATAWPNVIFAPMSPSKKSACTTMSIAFRDEFGAAQWRALSTRVRHQPRATRWPHSKR